MMARCTKCMMMYAERPSGRVRPARGSIIRQRAMILQCDDAAQPPAASRASTATAATNGRAGQHNQGAAAAAAAALVWRWERGARDTLREAQRERMDLTIDVMPQRVTSTQNQILLLCRTGTFMRARERDCVPARSSTRQSVEEGGMCGESVGGSMHAAGRQRAQHAGGDDGSGRRGGVVLDTLEHFPSPRERLSVSLQPTTSPMMDDLPPFTSTRLAAPPAAGKPPSAHRILIISSRPERLTLAKLTLTHLALAVDARDPLQVHRGDLDNGAAGGNRCEQKEPHLAAHQHPGSVPLVDFRWVLDLPFVSRLCP